MRGKHQICFLLALICLSMLVIFSHPYVDNHTERKWGEFGRTESWPLEGITRNATSERTNIFFLKTHKCASSTVQNILMRFGYLRHLNFVLPAKFNYLGHPTRFSRSMIPLALQTPTMKYNIFTHHTRYNHNEMRAVMEANASFVTILRNPVDVYESLYSYYRLNVATNMTLQEAIRRSPPKIFKPFHFGRITLNQMSFDLGFDVSSNNHSAFVDFVRKIEEEFDLVMITEHMEASLVLLCQLMNWPLENVVHLTTNSRAQSRKTSLTLSERSALMRYNSLDAQLYRHFLKLFKSRVVSYGVDDLKRQVTKLIVLNSELWQRCVDKPNMKGYGNTLSYDLRNPQDFACFYSTKNELAFTDEIRYDQMKRLAALAKLDELMNSDM